MDGPRESIFMEFLLWFKPQPLSLIAESQAVPTALLAKLELIAGN